MQVNRQRLEETVYVAFSLLLYLRYLEEQRGRGFKVIMKSEGEKLQTKGPFMECHKKLPGELTTELLFLELPTCFSLLLIKNIYALHKFPCY